MSTPSLNSVAIELVDRSHQAAQHLVRAYQAGVERAARSGRERFAAAVQQRSLPLVDDAIKSSLIDAQQRASQIIVAGLQARSAALAVAQDRVAEGVKAGIERLHSAVGRIDAAFDGRATQTLSLFGLPSAQLALSVADTLAAGAERIEARVRGDNAEAVVVRAQPAPRKAARRTKRG